MARQGINIGSSANDGTGDPLRTAFDKINDNFVELYGGDNDINTLDANLDVNNFAITTGKTNGDVTITPNGTGSIKLGAMKFVGTTMSSDDSTQITIAENIQTTGTLNVAGATALSSTLSVGTSLALATGATVTGIDNGALGSSATLLATQGAIKTYVDSQVTAQDLDLAGDSGTGAIDLDSQSLTIAGGTGLDSVAGSQTVTLNIDSTVATLTGSQTLTNKVLTSPTINSPTITNTTIVGNATIGAVTTNDIISNGSNADITIDPAGTGNINLTAGADVVIPTSIGLVLDGAGAEKIESDGTDISISVGANGDINIPADIGLTFGNDGEKIEGDGTDLTITGNNIKLTATTDVIIPTNVGLHFTDANEKIESDGSKITITSGGTAFAMPTADGTDGQALITDGSGTLSFGTVGATPVSDDGAAIVITDKHITSVARTVDSFQTTFQDSVLYYVVSNDFNEDAVNIQKVSVCHNDSASFISSAGTISKASTTNMTTFSTTVDNNMVRVKATTTNAVGGSLSFYKFGLGDNTATGTSGNVIISQNTDVDSASESLVSFAHATFRGAKLFISINNNAKTEVGNTEALVVHDGTNAFISQFGGLQTGDNPLLTLTAAISGDNVVVSAAGGEANLRVTIHAIMLKDTMVSNDGTHSNSEAIAPVTISSGSTAVDELVESTANGAVYYLVSKNATEGAYAVNEVILAMGGADITVASSAFVSTKETNQLTFDADFKTDAENTGRLLCASTSGANTTVSAYRINLLAK